MPGPDIGHQLRRIAAALKPLGVRWYFFGDQAVIAAGAVRTTADLDITTEDMPVEKLRRALTKAGFTPRRDITGIDELIEQHRILPLEHASGLQLDVVRAGPGPEQEMLGRLIHRKVGRSLIPFVSTDDLLVLKVLAGRDKDLEDVRALLDDSTLVALLERLCLESKPSRRALCGLPYRGQASSMACR